MAFSNKRSDIIRKMFRKWSGTEAEEIIPLPPSGSQRSYYRVRGVDSESAIAAFNENARENKAFIYLARHFNKQGSGFPGSTRKIKQTFATCSKTWDLISSSTGS
ncbi:MAG: hypothetical protein U5Q03_02430 [Bacteroidota bacterium]|nr:hypothetical protein [Bacteroidota bacterium]